jgi:hypothetical protein
MEVKGMSKLEAELKVAEIDASAPIVTQRPTPTGVTATTVTI